MTPLVPTLSDSASIPAGRSEPTPHRPTSLAARSSDGAQTVPDEFLVSAMNAGDWRALDVLIDRYDRLVRYTIFRASRERCLKDPAWLDSLSSSAWAGFVEAARKAGDSGPRSVRNLVVTIARNQAISALRQISRRPAELPAELASDDETALDIDPAMLSDGAEQLEHLRLCLGQLGEADKVIFSQLGLITERRWQEAAAALGRSESTLRSQWKRILEKLRDVMVAKEGVRVAPTLRRGD